MHFFSKPTCTKTVILLTSHTTQFSSWRKPIVYSCLICNGKSLTIENLSFVFCLLQFVHLECKWFKTSVKLLTRYLILSIIVWYWHCFDSGYFLGALRFSSSWRFVCFWDGLHEHGSGWPNNSFFSLLPCESSSKEAGADTTGDEWEIIMLTAHLRLSSVPALSGTTRPGWKNPLSQHVGQKVTFEQTVASRPRERLADTHVSTVCMVFVQVKLKLRAWWDLKALYVGWKAAS